MDYGKSDGGSSKAKAKGGGNAKGSGLKLGKNATPCTGGYGRTYITGGAKGIKPDLMGKKTPQAGSGSGGPSAGGKAKKVKRGGMGKGNKGMMK